jgi:glycosyltransferase involved in cell wall biosynthesis
MAVAPVNKKPVLVTTPVLLSGGTEMQMLSMVRILIKEGYRVSVCCYYEFDPAILAEFESAGAAVNLLRLKRSTGKSTLDEIAILYRLLRKLFQAHPDSIVHIQYVAPGLIPVLAAKFSGIKTIFATIHYPRHMLGLKDVFFVRLASRMCTLFICNSSATERSWFGTSEVFSGTVKTDQPHCTIFNGVDEKKIGRLSSSVNTTAARKKLGIKREKVVGVIGRLRGEKGHEFLFRAMVGVLSSRPSVKLLMLGDGPDRNFLMSRAKDLRIEKNVVWGGTKAQRDIFSLYGIMDLVVVPSQFEGFSLTAAEAMAAGVPVVASDVGGLRDVVDDHETGLLVPYNDIERLQSAILQLLNDEKLSRTLGVSGRKKVKRQFSMEQYKASLLAVYRIFSENKK